MFSRIALACLLFICGASCAVKMKNPARSRTVVLVTNGCRIYLDGDDLKTALEKAKPAKTIDSIQLAAWTNRLSVLSVNDSLEIQDMDDIPLIPEITRSLAIKKLKKGDASVYSSGSKKRVGKIIIRRRRNGDCRETRFIDASDQKELWMIADKCKSGKLY